MALKVHEQIRKNLEQANHILITFRKHATGDSIASALALYTYLDLKNKRVDMVCDDFAPPSTLSFLSKISLIKPALSFLQKFIISIDIKDIGIEELNYDVEHEKLRIFVTPKQGFITGNHIRTAQTKFKYDIIFVVDSPDLESLGNIYQKNSDLFFQVPVINIDNHSENEHFGHINLVDITATSTSELVYKFIKEDPKAAIDESLATTLLTGIIAKTKSFKTNETKPHTLNIASELINLGADRDYIIKNLYRTRSVNALKLWGQALTHLKHDRTHNLVWTTITREDFVRSGANEYDLHDIVDELISNSPEAKVTLILYEPHHKNGHPTPVHAMLTVEDPFDAAKLVGEYGPLLGDKKRVSFVLDGMTLKEAEEKLIDTLKKNIREMKK
ncbi:MAG: hypothetical protein COV59_01480 [Candidatus Magasanikbacteria bacterium CG11_big_fil_rev_8_21_14_0_20_39_34]|uniref:DDH domain-containing protein n=1 Tax=Candidatus Magasanikbacteria bacterium CG11_big_fil_rev_8_21_14_0_20_39_34 TaxID=1974653 RepID=A0A2H0N5W5_9BACT|nr:MAG: hypothetical protein COV59_01480 [Candidatus Magasanikbacteria bacterium CG11_big_fil_rev_8_21_14_0_20_39_34]